MRHWFRALLVLLLLGALVSAAPLPSANKDHTIHLSARDDSDTDRSGLWWKIIVIVILIILDGIVAGLILGLMSLDETDLRILKTSGTPSEQKAAAKIEPVRANGHLLLVTLLLANCIINEVLPILLSPISGGGLPAVVISTVAIVIFAEIIPQSVCSRYGLQIGAFFIWPVRVLIWIFFIVSWPIAKLLDYLLGAGHGMMYKKGQLKELLALHGTEHGGDLTHDEVTILQGTLNVHSKKVMEVMTPIQRVYMLPSNAKLDRAQMQEILKNGHSRIPIFSGTKTNIVGILLVKTLILLDPEAATPVELVRLITKFPRAAPSTNLFDMLNTFQEGASHLATVYDNEELIGIITIEDVIEEIIQEEIVDETDQFTSNDNMDRVTRPALSSRPTFPILQLRKATNNNQSTISSTHTATSPSKLVIPAPRKEKKFMGRAAHRSASGTPTTGFPGGSFPTNAFGGSEERSNSLPGQERTRSGSSTPRDGAQPSMLEGARTFQEPERIQHPARNEVEVNDLAISTGEATPERRVTPIGSVHGLEPEGSRADLGTSSARLL
ncbi:hypothetical protein HKX48_002429 [Thoreauomyces humboldtii]|nr:hypothetical protein HKX48_002429 [Thoreauomyces humboldtii]